jgi:hypothetical protein
MLRFDFREGTVRLSSPSIKSGLTKRSKKRAVTTEPGYRNPNGQVVVAATGAPSTTHLNQRVYRMRCEHCGHEYGAAGIDIHGRLCPRHQNGVKGEALREPAPMLFS